MGKICFCLITFALVLYTGSSVEAKGKKCKKPMGLPGDLAKCNGKGKWEREYPLQTIQETVVENGEKLDELIMGEYGEKNNCPMVVFGNEYDLSQKAFNPYHVISNEEDIFYRLPDDTVHTNYWLVNDYKTGTEARLYMAFTCARTIKGFLLKNTCNGERGSRGTKDFTISISDSIDGPWTDILTGTLPDALDVSPVPVLNFDLENEVETKVVRFQIDSFYRLGGGLQYFSTY